MPDSVSSCRSVKTRLPGARETGSSVTTWLVAAQLARNAKLAGDRVVGEIFEDDAHGERRVAADVGRDDNFIDGDLATPFVADRHAVEADAGGEHFRGLRQRLAEFSLPSLTMTTRRPESLGRVASASCRADSRLVNCGSHCDSTWRLPGVIRRRNFDGRIATEHNHAGAVAARHIALLRGSARRISRRYPAPRAERCSKHRRRTSPRAGG